MNAEIIANISSEDQTDIDIVRNVLEQTDNPELHYAFAVLLHDNGAECYREEIISHLKIASRQGHPKATSCLNEWFSSESNSSKEGSN